MNYVYRCDKCGKELINFYEGWKKCDRKSCNGKLKKMGEYENLF